jgi:hypothetical protein
MDIKEFRESVISLSCTILILSFGILIGSYFASPYLSLDQFALNFITILSIMNLVFCLFYLIEAQRSKNIFRLEIEFIIRYTRILGVSILLYSPHTISLIFFLFMNMALMEKLIIFTLLVFEILLIYIIIQLVHNIIFVDENTRKANIEKNRRN